MTMTGANKMSYALQTKGLTRHFQGVTAVDAIDLAVPQGAVFGFLGPNGAGKTTTIRMLLGLIKPTSGNIVLNGHDIHTHREQALTGVGAIVESPALYAHLTGTETMAITAKLLRKPLSAVAALIELVGLTNAADRTVKTYSLGMRQRLALARALIGEPRLLILDEPTNGLDPAGIAQMRNLIRELPSRFGTTVLLSSHLLSEIEQMADHCALIANGKLVFQDRLEVLQARARPQIVIETTQPKDVQRHLAQHNVDVDIDIDFEMSKQDVRVHRDLNTSDRTLLLAGLVKAGIPVSGFWVERPNLESLFLQLTGASEAIL